MKTLPHGRGSASLRVLLTALAVIAFIGVSEMTASQSLYASEEPATDGSSPRGQSISFGPTLTAIARQQATVNAAPARTAQAIQASLTAQAQASLTAQAQASLTAQAQAIQTAQAIGAKTSIARLTMTAQANMSNASRTAQAAVWLTQTQTAAVKTLTPTPTYPILISRTTTPTRTVSVPVTYTVTRTLTPTSTALSAEAAQLTAAAAALTATAQANYFVALEQTKTALLEKIAQQDQAAILTATALARITPFPVPNPDPPLPPPAGLERSSTHPCDSLPPPFKQRGNSAEIPPPPTDSAGVLSDSLDTIDLSPLSGVLSAPGRIAIGPADTTGTSQLVILDVSGKAAVSVCTNRSMVTRWSHWEVAQPSSASQATDTVRHVELGWPPSRSLAPQGTPQARQVLAPGIKIWTEQAAGASGSTATGSSQSLDYSEYVTQFTFAQGRWVPTARSPVIKSKIQPASFTSYSAKEGNVAGTVGSFGQRLVVFPSTATSNSRPAPVVLPKEVGSITDVIGARNGRVYLANARSGDIGYVELSAAGAVADQLWTKLPPSLPVSPVAQSSHVKMAGLLVFEPLQCALEARSSRSCAETIQLLAITGNDAYLLDQDLTIRTVYDIGDPTSNQAGFGPTGTLMVLDSISYRLAPASRPSKPGPTVPGPVPWPQPDPTGPGGPIFDPTIPEGPIFDPDDYPLPSPLPEGGNEGCGSGVSSAWVLDQPDGEDFVSSLGFVSSFDECLPTPSPVPSPTANPTPRPQPRATSPCDPTASTWGGLERDGSVAVGTLLPKNSGPLVPGWGAPIQGGIIGQVLREPFGIAISPSGVYYVTDPKSKRLVVLCPDETVGAFIGGFRGVVASKEGIYLVTAGSLDVASARDSSDRVRVPDASILFIDQTGLPQALNNLVGVRSIAPHSSGGIVVSTSSSVVIRDSTGTILPRWSAGLSRRGLGAVAESASGDVYVAQYQPSDQSPSRNSIYRIGPDGSTLAEKTLNSAEPDFFHFPHSMAYDNFDDSLYVSLHYGNRVVQLDAKTLEVKNVVVASDGRSANPGDFQGPTGIAIDQGRSLWILDQNLQRLQNRELELIRATPGGYPGGSPGTTPGPAPIPPPAPNPGPEDCWPFTCDPDDDSPGGDDTYMQP